MTRWEDAVALERDACCFRDLNWRCDLGGLVTSTDAMIGALSQRGYGVQAGAAAGTVSLLHPAGHVVVVVTKTLRVQIRLHYLTPAAERPLVARALLVELVAAAGSQTTD